MQKKVLTAIFMILLLGSLCGCGGEEKETFAVNIEDGNVETIVDVTGDETVEEVIAEAELALGEKDQVKPALTEKVTKDTVITIERYAQVVVRADKKEYDLQVMGGRVGDALEKANITLEANDVVNHDPEAFLYDGMDVEVTRMTSVTFVADGKTKTMLTEAETVKDFLEMNNVTVGKDDRLSMKEETKLQDGDKIVLKRVTYKTKTVEENIPYSTTYRTSKSMKRGTTKVSRRGVNGRKKVTYKICYVDGKEESKKQISSSVIKHPTNRVVIRGTKASKHIVKKWKEVECDGTIIWHIKYSDGSTKIYYR